jgi:hypothetical protein
MARHSLGVLFSTSCLLLGTALAVVPARAQTDFYNTDRGRPLETEDALVIERRAFELQLAPLTRTRVARGVTAWTVAPELAWGLAPRTQLEVSLPLATTDSPATGASTALAGVDVEMLHSLNAETMSLPALALGAGVHLPAGGAGPERATGVLRALATRTFAWGRLHLNGSSRVGSAGDALDSQWTAGLAVDRTFVFRSLLVGAEVVARDVARAAAAPGSAQRVAWQAGAGVRHQLNPRLAGDLGVRRTLSAGEAQWTVTAGAAYAFAMPSRGEAR